MNSSYDTNNTNNNQNGNQLWWKVLTDMSNNHRIYRYTPKWRQLCSVYRARLLPSERKNFFCNPKIRNLIPPLRGVIHLTYPYAFMINSRAYYQIHSANTEGYPINWFVYDASARDNIASQRRLDQDIIDQILDMFSKAEDKRLQFIRKEQNRFRKGRLEKDESIDDKAELHPNIIYLPASHTLSFRWSYKKTMDALAIVNASHALGLLDDTTEYIQYFTEAISYNCTPSQLCLLFCHLIIEGMTASNIWQDYQELLSADFINKKGDIQQGKDEVLIWIMNFLEEYGINITQIGLPQPTNYFSEVICTRIQYSDYDKLISKYQEIIYQLNTEQKLIYQKIMNH
ncbi:11824_t:CDS:2, partial [Dentiscutata erythropus]